MHWSFPLLYFFCCCIIISSVSCLSLNKFIIHRNTNQSAALADELSSTLRNKSLMRAGIWRSLSDHEAAKQGSGGHTNSTLWMLQWGRPLALCLLLYFKKGHTPPDMKGGPCSPAPSPRAPGCTGPLWWTLLYGAAHTTFTTQRKLNPSLNLSPCPHSPHKS